jgi:hypothetical protein
MTAATAHEHVAEGLHKVDQLHPIETRRIARRIFRKRFYRMRKLFGAMKARLAGADDAFLNRDPANSPHGIL